MILSNLIGSFLAGLFAPLGAVCVLPLYPGFLAYLANQVKDERKNTLIFLGLITTFGVVTSMAIFGFIFTKLLQQSLTNAIGIISPIAFIILGIISLLMIFGIDFGNIFPKINSPITKNPYLSSFLFGFFFGLIVLPCNPASLVVLFALSTNTVSFIANFFGFILFGIGMAFPLLLFAIIGQKSSSIIKFLTNNQRKINLVAGIIMLAISIYYLFFVFKII
jgi:cytochrome c-type biogenesis protein